MTKKHPPSASVLTEQDHPRYEIAPYFLVRAPALPISTYLSLAETSVRELIERDMKLRFIAGTGSTSLMGDLVRPAKSADEAAHREQAFLRYLIRMTTRPTPFGAMAGSALGHWGSATEWEMTDDAPHFHVRVDMQWLTHIVSVLEVQPMVYPALRFHANTAALWRGSRVHLLERCGAILAKGAPAASIRATRVTTQVLQQAREWTGYSTLVEHLQACFPATHPSKIALVLRQLIAQTFLLSDLRPPLTGSEPIDYVIERLAVVPAAGTIHQYLVKVRHVLAHWQRHMHRYDLAEMQAVVALLHERDAIIQPFLSHTEDTSLPEPSSGPGERSHHQATPPQHDALFALDMSLPLHKSHLSREVAKVITAGAEILLQLSPVPQGYVYLEQYRRAFLERYGESRDVPILEVLDPNYGLGPVKPVPGTLAEDAPIRRFALQELILEAWHNRTHVIELTDEILRKIRTSDLRTAKVPGSFDMYLCILASSKEAIDAGDFQVLLSPNGTAIEGGNSFGRFARLLNIGDTLRQNVKEHSAADPTRLHAELAAMPRDPHLANMLLRPATCPYQIAYGVTPSVDEAHVIPIDELALGIRHGRFALLWTKKQREVIVHNGHMVNFIGAPPLVRLLGELGHDRETMAFRFTWFPYEELPFLPRLQRGKMIFAPAQWQLHTSYFRERFTPRDAAQFAQQIEQWRGEWQVGQYVYLADADHRLLLDLANPRCVEILRETYRKLGPATQLTIQEGLPSPLHAVLPRNNDRFIPEIVVMLTKQAKPLPFKDHAFVQTVSPQDSTEGMIATDSPERMRPFGSDWLFLKLYGGKDFTEEVIAGPLRALIQEVMTRRLADAWFYIRYADPEPHIRLRFRGTPTTLVQHLAPLCALWAEGLRVAGQLLTFAFDTYEREIERYGGCGGMLLAERVFEIDSTCCADLIAARLNKQTTFAALPTAALSVHSLLFGLGFTMAQQLAWCNWRNSDRQAGGDIFRAYGNAVRTVLLQPEQPIPQEEILTHILAIYRDALAHLAQSDLLPSLPAERVASYVHMHCNRLFGLVREKEDATIALLKRVLAGLQPQAHIRRGK
ncbi:MAG: lantibiotic dehydratase [Ktedonobacteraceae bacterium]|nr:lantibiotic dehydratase [Ktedonobacteraceae bacterium]MBA3822865.1 lantibiotic dehydratase [Ktedonobacterales bacterium]